MFSCGPPDNAFQWTKTVTGPKVKCVAAAPETGRLRRALRMRRRIIRQDEGQVLVIDFSLFSASLTAVASLCSAPRLSPFTMHLQTPATARRTVGATLGRVGPPPAARQMARTEGSASTPPRRPLPLCRLVLVSAMTICGTGDPHPHKLPHY